MSTLSSVHHRKEHDSLLAVGRVKSTTYHRLLSLANGTLGAVMSELLMNDPASPLLDKHQYIAFDRRLSHVIQEITRCIDKHGHDGVLVF